MSATENISNEPERQPSGRKRRPRSAVTSGRKMWIDGDPRSAWSRRYSDLVRQHADDLGGSDHLSASQLSLIRRAAALTCECEQVESRASLGIEVDLDAYGRAASHLRRILETLGLERREKPKESLSAYLARLHARDAKTAQAASAASPQAIPTATDDGGAA